MKTGKDVFAELKAEGEVDKNDALACAATDMASDLADVYADEVASDSHVMGVANNSEDLMEAFEKGIDFGIYRFLIDLHNGSLEGIMEELHGRRDIILFSSNKDNN